MIGSTAVITIVTLLNYYFLFIRTFVSKLIIALAHFNVNKNVCIFVDIILSLSICYFFPNILKAKQDRSVTLSLSIYTFIISIRTVFYKTQYLSKYGVLHTRSRRYNYSTAVSLHRSLLFPPEFSEHWLSFSRFDACGLLPAVIRKYNNFNNAFSFGKAPFFTISLTLAKSRNRKHL